MKNQLIRSIYFMLFVLSFSSSKAQHESGVTGYWTGKQKGFKSIYILHLNEEGHFTMKRYYDDSKQGKTDSIGFGKQKLNYTLQNLDSIYHI